MIAPIVAGTVLCSYSGPISGLRLENEAGSNHCLELQEEEISQQTDLPDSLFILMVMRGRRLILKAWHLC